MRSVIPKQQSSQSLFPKWTISDAHIFANKSGLLGRVLSGAECGTRVVYYDLELNVITSSVTSPNCRELELDFIVRSG